MSLVLGSDEIIILTDSTRHSKGWKEMEPVIRVEN